MLAVDSSTWIALYKGQAGPDTELLIKLLDHRPIAAPPIVVSELLSDPSFPAARRASVGKLHLLEILPGYWERAGLMRALLLKKKLKPKLPDTLIAQSCIDHDVALLTRDKDFSIFAKHCGLKLYKAA